MRRREQNLSSLSCYAADSGNFLQTFRDNTSGPIFRGHESKSTQRNFQLFKLTALNYSGHYMYRTAVTICTAQWSLYIPHSGHSMYRTAVTICTAQWSLYVPHSGHYMYRIAVTICTAQQSLYVPHIGHYMYHQFNVHKFNVLPTQCIYVFCVDLRTNSDYFPIQHWLTFQPLSSDVT